MPWESQLAVTWGKLSHRVLVTVVLVGVSAELGLAQHTQMPTDPHAQAEGQQQGCLPPWAGRGSEAAPASPSPL
ncbi:hypothetical protein H8959_014030 [Pygathrix nigripes]